MKSKIQASLLFVSSALFIATATYNTVFKYEVVDTPKTTEYGTVVEKSFVINAFVPKKGEYSFRLYDGQKTKQFLNEIGERFEIGDIIEVDGLKWEKYLKSIESENGIESWADWRPYPNPPMPVLEDGEDVGVHVREYAKWINDHPHFGYPPIPLFED